MYLRNKPHFKYNINIIIHKHQGRSQKAEQFPLLSYSSTNTFSLRRAST